MQRLSNFSSPMMWLRHRCCMLLLEFNPFLSVCFIFSGQTRPVQLSLWPQHRSRTPPDSCRTTPFCWLFSTKPSKAEKCVQICPVMRIFRPLERSPNSRKRPSLPIPKEDIEELKKNLLKKLLSSVPFWLQEFPLSAVVPPSVRPPRSELSDRGARTRRRCCGPSKRPSRRSLPLTHGPWSWKLGQE